MKVSTEALEHCEVLLTIEFEPQKEQDLLKKAAKRIARQVRIPGFRPGKAPFNTVVRRFGLEAVQQEVLENLSDKFLEDALEEAELEPYAQVQLEGVNWDPLTLKLRVPTAPKVELGDYRDVRLEPEPVVITDEEIEDELKELQEANAFWSPVDRPAEMGDLLSMTITERDGDEILVEEEAVEYELTPPDEAEERQPDLTTPLLGLRADESKTFSITYPEDFDNAKYAGREVTVTVDVSAVKEKELDPLDDDFAQAVSEFDTLEALQQEIRKNLRTRKERQRDSKLGSEVLDKIIENGTIEWPPALEEEEIKEEKKRLQQQLTRAGLTTDDYLRMENKTEEEWQEELRLQVKPRIKRSLALTKVAELEELEVSQSEILEQAKILGDLIGSGEQFWQQVMTSPAQQNMIASDVMVSKVIDRLAAIGKGEAPEIGAEEEPEEPAAESEIPSETPTPVVEEPSTNPSETPPTEEPAFDTPETEEEGLEDKTETTEKT